jgi:glycosyltransferase involved in cell wall biosynthesis
VCEEPDAHPGSVTLGQNGPAERDLTAVLIDGYALSDGSHLRGIGTYLKRVIAGAAAAGDLSVSVLAGEDVPLPDGVRRVPASPRLPLRARNLEHDLLLPRRLDRLRPDVFHSPAQEPPRRSPVPWVQTLHDLTPLTRPDPMLAADRRRWTRIGPRLRGAAAVVAVSRFSADEAISRLGIDPGIVTVIPNGVDPAVFHPGDAGVGERRIAEHPYLLHVAAWGPHKGYPEALAVIARLADSGLPHRLVLAGPQDDWMLEQVRAAVAASPRPDRVEVAGYVEDLPGAYRGATALLMTSRCEGFGLPVLEAMACGTPVVAFSNSSIPEVAGDAGALVPDGDVEAMANAVRRLVADPAAREELVGRGLEQAARFRWEDAIRAYLDVLRSVAG